MTLRVLMQFSRNFHSKLFGLRKVPSRDSQKVLKEAEAIVGYPTSFLNLKFLLSDEVANIGVHLRKLMGTKHPLLSTIKELFLQNELPTWGLIVLLVAKAAGQKTNFSSTERDSSAGILYGQRALAEITEMIRKSIQIHRGILNFPPLAEGADVLNFGNKMALLSGDFLLSKSYAELAKIRNQDVTEIISMGLRDFIDGEFVGPRDKQNNPLPAKPASAASPTFSFDRCEEKLKADDVLGDWKGEWLLRNTLSGCNLLGRACEGCFILAGHEESLNREAFLFGKCLGLALQACLENKMFLEGKLNKSSLISLPVLFYLHDNSENYTKIEKGLEDVDKIDYELLFEDLMKTSGLHKSKEVRQALCNVAQEKLDIFPEQSAKTVLHKIVRALKIDT